MSAIETRLKDLGLELPIPPKPVAAYIPFVRSGNLIFISGQIPMLDGKLICTGRVPDEIPPNKATGAARMCALNLLAVLRDAVDGDLDRVRRVVRLGIFVWSDSHFTDQPQIGNAASELMVQAFGEEIGRHTRAAVGSVALPLGASVEIDGIFEVE